MKALSEIRRTFSTVLPLIACLGLANTAWSACEDASGYAEGCAPAADKYVGAVSPWGGDWAEDPDRIATLDFEDLRFNLPADSDAAERNRREVEEDGEWLAGDGQGFALFVGNLARVQSDGSVELGRGKSKQRDLRSRSQLPSSAPNQRADALDVDLGLSYAGEGGFSSSVGFAEDLGNNSDEVGVVGWFRYRF